ncbi:MAG: hypothetical protein JO171_14185 [Paludibacterium sp.]|uniref:hypothetical protein n=1 Tax=Paludibacterium sp. TaxID=1917523 RepID=UPI0025DA9783|nr:hypothetical protein [Paludibacterium sp.]MBV8048303.1 hypothetical protein [Paludibacterium sp.]
MAKQSARNLPVTLRVHDRGRLLGAYSTATKPAPALALLNSIGYTTLICVFLAFNTFDDAF